MVQATKDPRAVMATKWIRFGYCICPDGLRSAFRSACAPVGSIDIAIDNVTDSKGLRCQWTR
eukprot:359073-Amphidinium_carterae.2